MDQYIRSQLLSAVNNQDNERLIATYQKIKAEGEFLLLLFAMLLYITILLLVF